jgi:Rrf2 family protein
MKLNRTAGYAIHVMVRIARHNDDGQPVRGHLAAKELGIPEGFLLRILASLARGRLLWSVKGPNGGYNLARAAKAITLLDIIEAVEGSIIGRVDPTASPLDGVDEKLQEVATAITDSVRKEFKRVTLAELVVSRKKGR